MSQLRIRKTISTATFNNRKKVGEDIEERYSKLKDHEEEKYRRLQKLRAKRDFYKVD